jgi:hypothetical protein
MTLHPFPLNFFIYKENFILFFISVMWCRYPSSPARDTEAVSGYGCDAVVFLVFNEYAKDCKTPVYGHKYGGASQVTHNTAWTKIKEDPHFSALVGSGSSLQLTAC